VSTSTADGADALHGGSGPVGPVGGLDGCGVELPVNVVGGMPVDEAVALRDGEAPVDPVALGELLGVDADDALPLQVDKAADSDDAFAWHTEKLARRAASSAAHDSDAEGLGVVDGDTPAHDVRW
jgi:hypothetical protein